MSERIKYKDMASDSVENWCKLFASAETRVLTEQESDLVLKCLMLEDELASDPAFDKEFTQMFIGAVITKRLKAFTYKLTNAAKAVLADWVKSLGENTMYLAYIQYYCHNNKVTKVTAKELCEIFPDGIPTQSELQRLWDLQKLNLSDCNDASFMIDNLLDYKHVYESIMSI